VKQRGLTSLTYDQSLDVFNVCFDIGSCYTNILTSFTREEFESFSKKYGSPFSMPAIMEAHTLMVPAEKLDA